MDSANSGLKSLDWKKLLRKSSDDEYDSDETFCQEADGNKLLSPETVIDDKIIQNRVKASRMGETVPMDIVEENSISDLLENVQICDSKVKAGIFYKPEHYDNIDGTNNSSSTQNDTINNYVHHDVDKLEINNLSTATRISRQKYDEKCSGDPLKSFSSNLDRSETYSEVDLSFLEEITHSHNETHFPTATLSNESHRQIQRDENNKFLNCGEKRKNKKIMNLGEKKLPQRKCASLFIKKSNRMLGEPADISSNSDLYSFKDKAANQDKNLFYIHQSENSKKYRSSKRGRPRKVMNESRSEQIAEEKFFGKSILQNLEDDLNQLKRRLCQSIKTREEAFQMLSHVQKITQSLKFHLYQATKLSKNKQVKNRHKFLLLYLSGQIAKAEELERFLDNAISEADRLTDMETGNESGESELLGINEEESDRISVVRKEECHIKSILKNSSTSSKTTENLSESKHISFSDEIEFRYLTCSSTQSSDTRERGVREKGETGQMCKSNNQDYFDPLKRYAQIGQRKEVQFETSNNPYEENAMKHSVQNTLCETGTQIKRYENNQCQLSTTSLNTTDSDDCMERENNDIHSLNYFIGYPNSTNEHKFILKCDEDKKLQTNTKNRLCTDKREYKTNSENKMDLKNNSHPPTCPRSIQTKNNLQMQNPANSLNDICENSSELLFGSENSITLNQKNNRVCEAFELQNEDFTSEANRKNNANHDLFETENLKTHKLSTIQLNDFKIINQVSFSQSSMLNDASFEVLRTENRGCCKGTEASFGFSQLPSSLTENPDAPYCQRVTIMDVQSVRIKEPDELIDLDDQDGGMEFALDFDFPGDDEKRKRLVHCNHF